MSVTAVPLSTTSSPWIRRARWDIGWLIGSAAIVPVVLAFVWIGTSSMWINLGITAIVGGPHLFSTYLATYMDPRFRRRHLWLLVAATILVPAFVVTMTLWNFQVLLSIFIFAASLHVLQQNAYLTDIYRKRHGQRERVSSRFIDYGLLMICIYPIASYKLVHGEFYLGDIEILLPPFLMTPATYWTVWIAFTAFLFAWLRKTADEYRTGVLNVPKTLLISVTTVIAFLVPIASEGRRLELAFQSVNAWHSIQYLGLVWFILAARRRQGRVDTPLLAKMSDERRGGWWFYGTCLAVTVLLLSLVYGLVYWDPIGLQSEQYYYMCVLSCLLIHYVLDAYLFTVSNRAEVDEDAVPFAAPAAA